MADAWQVDAREVCAAIPEVAGRLTSLLRQAGRAEAPAVGKWNLTDVAAHISHSVDAITGMSRGGGLLLEDIWGLSTLTETLVTGESTRTLGDLADRIDASIERFLAFAASSRPDEFLPWMVRGTELPFSAILCELLSELVLHGYDIARAEGSPWPIERAHAVLILEGFLFPVVAQLGRSLVDQQAAAGRRICFDVSVRGGGHAYFRFEDGGLSVTPHRPAPVDCHLSVDPVAFLLVSWGRMDQWPAIGRGKLAAWGRKPWLGLQLRSLMKNP